MLSAVKGNAAEAAVLGALVERGFRLLLPFGDGHPYDLAVHWDGNFLRVQCKRAWRRGGCMIFNARSTDHGSGPRSYVGLADLFGVYLPSSRAVYLVPIDAVAPFEGRLRLEPALNNRRKRIRLASDFEIDRWTPERLAALVPALAAAAA